MIEFESVGKTFRDGTAAVVDLSLTVPSDKITVIVGPSGCGKTTTLRMINRMLEPSSGKIRWDGAPLKSKRKTTLRRQMGYVIQNGGLFPHRTVIDNIGTVPGLLGWSKTKTRKRSIELLDAVGLDRKLANRFPSQLSGGQQQRVGVARALAADPLVLLMDEPFSSVDPVVRADLHELFLKLQRELSKTIVLITHDIDEAIKLGDQVAILRAGGKLAQCGTPQQLLDEPADAFVEGFVGKDRGYRALSFANAGTLSLGRVKAVRDPESARPGEPTLVVDGDACPLGWADVEHPGKLYGLGATFDPEHDNLRVALDAALTSPFGLAVAVTRETGRYAGVVTAADILAQVRQSRTAAAKTLSVREAESALSEGKGSEGKRDDKTTDGKSTNDKPVEGKSIEGKSDNGEPTDDKSLHDEFMSSESADAASTDGKSADDDLNDRNTINRESTDAESTDDMPHTGDAADAESTQGVPTQVESTEGVPTDVESTDAVPTDSRAAKGEPTDGQDFEVEVSDATRSTSGDRGSDVETSDETLIRPAPVTAAATGVATGTLVTAGDDGVATADAATDSDPAAASAKGADVDDQTPDDQSPDDQSPDDQSPDDQSSGGPTSGDQASGGQTGEAQAFEDQALDDDDNLLVDDLPTDDLPTDDLPTDDLPTGELPAEDLTVEDFAAEDLPIEESPGRPLTLCGRRRRPYRRR